MHFLLVIVFLLQIAGLQAKNSTLPYKEFCKMATQSDVTFVSFKNDPFYKKVIENVSFEDGQRYLDIIRTEYPELLQYINNFRENDLIGRPQVYSYEGIGDFSPTTLRYIKIFGDLKKAYGDRLKEMRIVEIGGGYGGLAQIISKMCGCASYTMMDLAECNKLSNNYFSLFGLQGIRYIDSSDKVGESDLFICCHPDALNKHTEILQKIITTTPYGYISYNIKPPVGFGTFGVNDVLSTLIKNEKKGTVIQSDFENSLDRLKLTWKPTRENQTAIVKEKTTNNSAITYDFSGGRLGDNLLSYFHAKWLAHEYGLPFLYRPFPHSESLLLSTKDKPYSSPSPFQNTLRLFDKQQILEIKPSTVVIVPYFTESKFEYEMLNHAQEKAPFYVVDWEDPEYHKEVVECLTPTIPVDYISLPENCITVAVHVRRGGERETYAEGARGYPLKFPSDNYYIDQIQRIADIYKDKSIYVYIFTDANNPQKIVNSFSKALRNSRINIVCKQEKKAFKGSSEMFNDFFSMGKFDCLVRSMSNFSVVASLLGDYSLMIFPTHAHFEKRKVVIDQVEIKFKDKIK